MPDDMHMTLFRVRDGFNSAQVSEIFHEPLGEWKIGDECWDNPSRTRNNAICIFSHDFRCFVHLKRFHNFIFHQSARWVYLGLGVKVGSLFWSARWWNAITTVGAPQLSSINSKISRAIFAIKQVKFTLPLDSLRTLYYALIHPHLIYGLLAWGNANLNLLHKTDILQKRALRTIHNKKYNSHTEPLYKHSGILKISHLYQLEVMLFMHDYTRDNLPTSFQNVFRVNREVHGIYETRQAHLFYIPWTKSRFVDKLPLFHFPKIWNSWCAQLDVCTTRNGLKRSVKTLFLQNYSVVVTCFNPRCCECNKTA